MNATSNPQTATEQAHKNYRDVTTQLGHLGLDTSVPGGSASPRREVRCSDP